MARSEIGAIILAAGKGARFRAGGGTGSKLLALYQGKPLVRHVAEAALGANLAGVMVVTGHEHQNVRAALDGLPLIFVQNADYASGMASSLKIGFAARPKDWQSAIILLGDMPLVDAALIGEIADADRDDFIAIVPVFDGVRGNPVLLSAKLASDIENLSGDAGARHLLRERKDVIELPVKHGAAHVDIDTPDALAHLAQSSNSSDFA